MPNNRVVFVMGDMEKPEHRMPQQLRPYLEDLGYTVLVASSYPGHRLAEVYGDTMPHVVSIDHLLPFNPKEHGYQQLHRRIALAVRLGGMARAFAMFPDAEVAVCGDSDGLMLMPAEDLRDRMRRMDVDVYTTALPLIHRPEAPHGWVNDLGMTMMRRGFERLAAALPDLALTWMPQTAPHVSVHGLLAHGFQLAGLEVWDLLLKGYYAFPNGRWSFVFNELMPEDSWLNSGAVITLHDRPYFAHACMKTMPDIGLPVNELFGWWLSYLASLPDSKETLLERDIRLQWIKTSDTIHRILKAADKPTDPATYWQNLKTMQLGAEGQPVPGPRADGPVTPVTAEIIRAALCP